MVKGSKHSLSTKNKISETKKGQIGYWNGKKRPEMVGNTNGFKKGQKSWCAGTKGVMKSNKTSFKKGLEPWNKNKPNYKVRGENHWNWKGGVTEENHKIKISLEYRLWRDFILKKYKWTCQECGVVGKNLQIHHIKSFSEYPKLRLNKKNGIVLCKVCHKLTDSYGSKRSGKTITFVDAPITGNTIKVKHRV